MDVRFAEEEYYPMSSVYGSAAPELETPERPLEEEQERTAARPAVRPRVRQRLRVPLFALLGWALVVVLLTSLILSYIELNSIADETYTLNKQITELMEERTQLKIKYESTFKLDEIEQYATNIIGMVPADNSQIRYLNDQAEDQAVILNRETGFTAWLRNFVTALSEYFN